MAHRLLRDPDADGWERADFPIVCETCLGPNPYVRMQRMEFGGECHISGRPYTKFRWRPGNDARYKGTIICQEVAKAKNVCQVCLLDLDYNLPVQVRDQALGMEDEALPESDVGKEYQLERMSKEGELDSSFAKAKPNDTILKLQRTTPYYQRNRAPICSFFVKGECKRGAECPYRHEMPTTGDLAQQNIKDRYYGVNDPVARKMMSRVDNLPALTPPQDPSITTLFIGGVRPEHSEEDLREAFMPYGDIQSVKVLEARHCAFVTFMDRGAAEKAAVEMQNKLIIQGTRLKLMWGRPQERRQETIEGAQAADGSEQAGPSGQAPAVPASMLPPRIQMNMGGAAPFRPTGPNFFGLPPGAAGGAPAYPSMDPSQAGTRVPAPGEQPKHHLDDAGKPPGAKRVRADAGPPTGPGTNFFPQGPPQGPPHGFPPPMGFPGRGPPFPGYGPRPAFVPMRPPPPGWRPPPGVRPPAQAPPAAASGEAAA